MRDIGPEWRNLAEGLLRVDALEAQLCAGWGSGSRRPGGRGTRLNSGGLGSIPTRVSHTSHFCSSVARCCQRQGSRCRGAPGHVPQGVAACLQALLQQKLQETGDALPLSQVLLRPALPTEPTEQEAAREQQGACAELDRDGAARLGQLHDLRAAVVGTAAV